MTTTSLNHWCLCHRCSAFPGDRFLPKWLTVVCSTTLSCNIWLLLQPAGPLFHFCPTPHVVHRARRIQNTVVSRCNNSVSQCHQRFVSRSAVDCSRSTVCRLNWTHFTLLYPCAPPPPMAAIEWRHCHPTGATGSIFQTTNLHVPAVPVILPTFVYTTFHIYL